MTVLPRAFAWQRTDTVGGEFVTLDDRRGLHAKGVAFAADLALYTCRYELHTDESWAGTRLEVTGARQPSGVPVRISHNPSPNFASGAPGRRRTNDRRPPRNR